MRTGFVTILILVILGIGIGVYTNRPVDKQNSFGKTPTIESFSEKTAETVSLSDSKDGVTVEISDLRFEDGKTIAILTMNNHIYDISSMDVEGLSSFANKKPLSYKILNTKMGGHHVESEITFEGKLSGNLVIGLNEDLIFNFKINDDI